MASFNRVILMGNITFDLELKYTSGGTAVTEVGVACNDRRKNQAGETIEETVFVDVTLWGRTAELACEYLKKGSPIFIEGRLKYDTWEKDGQKRSKLRVVGERMVFLPRGDGGGGGRGSRSFDESEFSRPVDYSNSSPQSSGESGGGPASGSGPPAAEDDDIPF